MISSVLDHAMDALRHYRCHHLESRKGLLEVMDHVESMLEVVTADWCDDVSDVAGTSCVV